MRIIVLIMIFVTCFFLMQKRKDKKYIFKVTEFPNITDTSKKNVSNNLYLEYKHDSIFWISCGGYSTPDSCDHWVPYKYLLKDNKIFVCYNYYGKTCNAVRYSLNKKDTTYTFNEIGGITSSSPHYQYGIYKGDTTIHVLNKEVSCFIFIVADSKSMNKYNITEIYMEKETLIPLKIIIDYNGSSGKWIGTFSTWEAIEVIDM